MTEPLAPDGGLAHLCGLLEDAGVEYFVDSGVLLGLRRSGALNAWEKDIDLAILPPSLPRLLAAQPTLEAAGYQVDVHRYFGRPYSVGVKPRGGDAQGLRAAVHVYFARGDWLWSPQLQVYVPPPAPDLYLGRRSLAGRGLRRLADRRFYRAETADGRASRPPDGDSAAYRMSRWAYRRIDRGRLSELPVVREVYVAMTWVIPRALVEPITERDLHGMRIPVPARLDDYLAYRYGDWRTPVRDWCYWEDDGAIRRRPPREVVRQLTSSDAVQR